MNRTQFLEQLEKLLLDIPEAERQEALDYYENYFEDAGADKEDAVIRELGSPGKVAAIIKADLKESSQDYAEYTERGYQDSRNVETQMPDLYSSHASGENTKEESDREKRARWRAKRGYHPEQKKSNGPMILTIILLVFLSPFLAGALGGILGVLLCIVFLPFILVFGLGAAVFALAVGGVFCLVTGIGACAAYPAIGMLTIGIGCLMLAVGILVLLALIQIAWKLLPMLLRKTTDFCSQLLNRQRKDGAKT